MIIYTKNSFNKTWIAKAKLSEQLKKIINQKEFENYKKTFIEAGGIDDTKVVEVPKTVTPKTNGNTNNPTK